MIFKRLNRTSPEQVFGVFQANETGIAADDLVALEDTSPDGVKIQQPTTATLTGIVGVADAAIANGSYGLVQVYGYRSTSRVLCSASTIAAFRALGPTNVQDYLTTVASVETWAQPPFISLESGAASDLTASLKIFIRNM